MSSSGRGSGGDLDLMRRDGDSRSMADLARQVAGTLATSDEWGRAEDPDAAAHDRRRRRGGVVDAGTGRSPTLGVGPWCHKKKRNVKLPSSSY